MHYKSQNNLNPENQEPEKGRLSAKTHWKEALSTKLAQKGP